MMIVVDMLYTTIIPQKFQVAEKVYELICGKEHKMEEIIKEVKEALKLYQIKGKVEINPIDSIRFVVYAEGTYFGIWDTDRKTFVD